MLPEAADAAADFGGGEVLTKTTEAPLEIVEHSEGLAVSWRRFLTSGSPPLGPACAGSAFGATGEAGTERRRFEGGSSATNAFDRLSMVAGPHKQN